MDKTYTIEDVIKRSVELCRKNKMELSAENLIGFAWCYISRTDEYWNEFIQSAIKKGHFLPVNRKYSSFDRFYFMLYEALMSSYSNHNEIESFLSQKHKRNICLEINLFEIVDTIFGYQVAAKGSGYKTLDYMMLDSHLLLKHREENLYLVVCWEENLGAYVLLNAFSKNGEILNEDAAHLLFDYIMKAGVRYDPEIFLDSELIYNMFMNSKIEVDEGKKASRETIRSLYRVPSLAEYLLKM